MRRALRRIADRLLGPSEEEDEEHARAKDDDRGDGASGTLGIVGFLVVPSALAVVVYTLIGGSWSDFGVAAMVAVGGFAAGAGLGFLFGIPRTLAADGGQVIQVDEHGRPLAPGAQPVRDGRTRYLPNTNLEDISNWLTKVLVGAGLVELTRGIRALGRLAEDVAVSFGGRAGERGAAWAFSLGLLVAFPVGGFLTGYVYTRLRLAVSFARADNINVAQLKHEFLAEVDEQKRIDAEALALVGRQLDPDDANPSVQELHEALRAASDGMRKQIFSQARIQRRGSWRTDKAKMALTIPVFEGLIAADLDERWFRNHGELGYVWYDSDPRQAAAAVASLDKAIEIRDRVGVHGFQRYDWIRAMARIADPTADPEVARELILIDLRRAATNREVALAMRRDTELRAWCRAQGLSVADVAPLPPA